MRRIKDYITQCENDLKAARAMLDSSMYEWACFLSHQASEKAIKAVMESKGVVERGHSLKRLLGAFVSLTDMSIPDELLNGATKLDVYFISSRHVTAFDIGTPHEHHTEDMAKEAIEIAENILEWSKREIGWEI